MSGDRYDPLPGLLEIPGWLLRKLSRRGRRIAALTATLLAAGAAVAAVLAVPAIDQGKADRAAEQARAVDRARAQRAARLRAEATPRRGRGTPARGLRSAAALAARRALAAELAQAVRRDAAARAPRSVRDVTCERYPRGTRTVDPAGRLGSRRARYACLAVTARIEGSEHWSSGAIGYPYRAAVDFATGRYAYCKVPGRPGEGSIAREPPVRVPAACGGTRGGR